MKILIDTNILISAALSSNGTPFKAYIKAVSYPNNGIICEQNIDELRRIFNRKFPKNYTLLKNFLHWHYLHWKLCRLLRLKQKVSQKYVTLWTDRF